jgi:microcystin-dependent protein
MTNISSVSTGFFPTAQEGFTTTTSGSVASGATTVGLNSVSGYTNGDYVVFVVDPTDTNKKQAFTGQIDTSGVQVTGVKWTEGTNQTHSAGATVVDYETATAWALQRKGWKVEHNEDGTHNTVTATTITATGAIASSGGRVSDKTGVVMPTGAVIDFAGSAAPTGWLLCYGQAVSRTTYADLFTSISTTYGTGDGSTTFNLPDIRGRSVAGKDDMGGTSANRLTGLSGGVDGDVLGGSGGAETASNTLSDNGQAQISTTAGGIILRRITAAFTANRSGSSTDAASSASASTAAALQGATDAGNNVQPTLILNKIIKT